MGRTDFLQHRLELGAHLEAEERVQVRQRLVHQQHRRLDGEGAGDRHPLPLAAGEPRGVPVQERLDVEQARGPAHLSVDHVLGLPLHREAERDVVGHRHVREHRVALEHHGEPALARGPIGHVPPTDEDAAAALPLEPGDDAQERRLAASGRPEEGDALPVGHGERDLRQRVMRAEVLGDPIDDDLGHGAPRLTSTRCPTPRTGTSGRRR
jgi:hypothetical protein